jgi:hypothetical protein
MTEKKFDGGASSKPVSGTDATKTAASGEESAAPDDRSDPKVDLGPLGAQLQKLYGSWLEEPVPDRFDELLKELERKERGKS